MKLDITFDTEYYEENKKDFPKCDNCEELVDIEEEVGEDECEVSFKDGNLHLCVSVPLMTLVTDIEIDDDLAFEIVKHLKTKGEKLQKLISIAKST